MYKNIKQLPVQPEGMTSIDENIEAIGDILYFTDRGERNAFVGQTWVELKTLIRKHPELKNVDSIYQALFQGGTDAGFKFLTCEKNLQELKRRYQAGQMSERDLKELKLWYNYVSGRGRYCKSVGRIFSDIEYRWKRFEKVFRNKIGKVVFDFVEEKINGKNDNITC